MDAREFGGTLAWKDRALEALATSRARLLDLLRPASARGPGGAALARSCPRRSGTSPTSPITRSSGSSGRSASRGSAAPRPTDSTTPSATPRRIRGELPLLGVEEAFAYAEQVRTRALRRLEAVNDEDLARTGALLDGGFVYGMVAQHEQQHVETLVATLQLVTSTVLDPLPSEVPLPERSVLAREVHVPGGPFEMGNEEAWAYDNERPRHRVHVPAFFIDRFPVTNGQFLAFMEDGGYANRAHWADAGWAFREAERLEHPLFWRRTRAGWEQRRFGTWEPLRLDEPVCHVCWYEADAYARWAGRRLPTEAEWEKAAAATPEGRIRRFPWGDAPPGPVAREPLAEGRTARSRRRVPGRGQCVRCRADDRRRLGVDGLGFRAVSGVSRVSVPGVFGRLLWQ